MNNKLFAETSDSLKFKTDIIVGLFVPISIWNYMTEFRNSFWVVEKEYKPGLCIREQIVQIIRLKSYKT